MKFTLGALLMVAQATMVFSAAAPEAKNDLGLNKRADCPYKDQFGCDNGRCWGPCGYDQDTQGRGGWAWLENSQTHESVSCTQENYQSVCDNGANQIPKGAIFNYGTADDSCHC
ncbi:hypothetical protein NUU61_004295 [Penicillium alfredii]|uniref:Uncharacterized protein n=1 Tax=Penicillium alfredii TaxID=1506179 RepID=A0A9W9KDT1_9EURO|nr:uncharacterized protein NUU61_004295 [Penicillium alfredii]KAJ5102073.1 hypothetical protein NUU61_004295 [Penicillium alfredii]